MQCAHRREKSHVRYACTLSFGHDMLMYLISIQGETARCGDISELHNIPLFTCHIASVPHHAYDSGLHAIAGIETCFVSAGAALFPDFIGTAHPNISPD